MGERSGRTNQPLTISAPAEWADKLAPYVDKGHVLVGLERSNEADIIFARNAWQWSDESWPYIEVALKEARLRKYGKRGSDAAESGTDSSNGKRPKRPAAK